VPLPPYQKTWPRIMPIAWAMSSHRRGCLRWLARIMYVQGRPPILDHRARYSRSIIRLGWRAGWAEAFPPFARWRQASRLSSASPPGISAGAVAPRPGARLPPSALLGFWFLPCSLLPSVFLPPSPFKGEGTTVVLLWRGVASPLRAGND